LDKGGERVRKLRDRGLIRTTTIDVGPAAVGRGVLASEFTACSPARVGDRVDRRAS
jgi:DNA-binding Lrp family transcriptional regulator